MRGKGGNGVLLQLFTEATVPTRNTCVFLGLFSVGHSSCQEPAPTRAPKRLQLPSGHINLLQWRALSGLQGDTLCHHDVLYGLQRNLLWHLGHFLLPPPSLTLVFAELFLYPVLTPYSQLLHSGVFYPFKNTLSQRYNLHHSWAQLWAAVGSFCMHGVSSWCLFTEATLEVPLLQRPCYLNSMHWCISPSSPPTQISRCSFLSLASCTSSKMANACEALCHHCFVNCSVNKIMLNRVCLQDGFCTSVWFMLGCSLAMTCVTELVVMQRWQAVEELLKDFQL